MNPSFCGYSLPQLEELLTPADQSQTQCDGCSRLVAHLLTQQQVQHFPRTGRVIALDGQTIDFHCWVELLEDQTGAMWRVDYRLRDWLGEDSPHGIVSPQPQHPLYLHFPAAMFGGELPPAEYRALTLEVDDEMIAQLFAQHPYHEPT